MTPICKTVLLLATAAAACWSAAGALAQSAPLPEGKIAIHYNRCDNAYDGWGVHLWKYPSFPLPDVTWQAPMMPTGKDDFGVVYQADFAEFGKSGSVNYIIHKGDSKEQGGSDMKFDGKAHKEAWVLSGDHRIYFSLDDAKKGRADKPCP